MNLYNTTCSLSLLLSITAFSACKTPPPLEFDSKRAYQDIEKQISFGPRVPQTLAHRQTLHWIVDELKKTKAQVTIQEAPLKDPHGKSLLARNIFATLNPGKTKRVMLSAHWDTRPIADQDPNQPQSPGLGANDGASGVAVLIELARQLSKQAPRITIDLAFWDAEDMGLPQIHDSYCLGSQYWAKNPHEPNYKALYGINLDMVGAKNAVFPIERFSKSIGLSVIEKVRASAKALGYEAKFPTWEVGPITDDHYYVTQLRGFPMIDLIHMTPEGNFFPAWHTHADRMEWIDAETLAMIGKTLLATLYQEE